MTGKMETQAERTQLMEIARQEVWNKTPFSYLRTGKKLTLLQIDTMLMVSDSVLTDVLVPSVFSNVRYG